MTKTISNSKLALSFQLVEEIFVCRATKLKEMGNLLKLSEVSSVKIHQGHYLQDEVFFSQFLDPVLCSS